jgi:flagellar hook-associated protein 2
VTGGVVSAGALAATALHINGVIVTTRATAIGNTAAQNAASLAADINGTSGIGVNAVANQDGTLTLTARTGGVGSSVSITQAGTGTGLSVGTVTQTSDVYVSTAGLATSQAGVNLPESRLAAALGFDADGNGAFKINGVSISYSNSDSLNAVLSRITASAAGVTASYDPLSDRVTMTSKNTGSVGISLEDVTGNFLQATGLLGTSQTLGKNAVFSVSSLQGGADLTSTSNIVSGILPGVDLTLNQVTTAPIEVSVSQNVNGTASAVQSFVSAFNATLAHVRSISRIDPSGKDAGILSTDSTVRGIEAGLRSMLVQQATGMSGKYQSLADIGLSFGAIGSAAGGTNDLVFDSAKFSAAMNDNPDAVASLLSGFRSTVTLAPGGTALASVSGQPASTREPGSYLIRTFTGGSISATFTPLNGSPGPEVFGSAIAGGGSDSLVIPGMTLTATNPLVDGESTITVAVQQKGILVALQDYLGRLTRSGGTLASKSTSIEAQVSDYQKRIEAAEARIAQKKARFEAQFAALETMMSRLQAQNSALMGQLQQLNNATRR